jgi:HAD superfamily hydrolase (TIGR01509 family)
MHDIHRAIGLPGSDLIAHLLGEDRDTGHDDALSAAHDTLYAGYFERLPRLRGADRLLRALHAQGWRVVLVTSAGGVELDALTKAIDADDAITATASADDVEAGKPAPDPIHHALGLAGAVAERSVFVGDSVWDMKAGRRAGVTCAGLLSGGIPKLDLESAGAGRVYRDPAHLLDDLEHSPFAAPRT